MTLHQVTQASPVQAVAPSPARKPRRQGFLADLLRHKGGSFGVTVMALFILLAVFGRLVSSYDPNVGELASTLSGPTAQHLFGTDELGRDTLSRVIDGSRIAVVVALLSVAVGAYTGLRQTNVKRLWAYTSIAQIGYAMVGRMLPADRNRRLVVVQAIHPDVAERPGQLDSGPARAAAQVGYPRGGGGVLQPGQHIR